ncbi:MAG: M14 family metallopeptidase [Elusimicrobia bacterium]|nr:M14 family metallopeptidase [Elusimicrobiota bacterium]
MKKLMLLFGTASLFCLSAASGGAPEKARVAADLSFERLLAALAADHDKGLSLPPAVPDAAASELRDRYWITVRAADKRERTRLLEAGLSIEEMTGDSVSGTIHRNSLELLSEKGFVVEQRRTLAEYMRAEGKDFPAADSAYHNYQETADLLRSLAAKNTDIASLFSLGRTIEGREMWTLRLNTSAKGEEPSSKPGAYFVGTHHAREHLATEVPLFFAVWLLDNRNAPDVKKYIDTLDIYITPMLNPDGVEYDIRGGRYRMHRKNARANSDGSVGVDLNRNYDSWWCTAGASSYPRSDTYCGTAPFSEPETQAVKRFVETRKNLKTLMSYHSFSNLILYPWGGKDAPVENERDRAVFSEMGAEMGRLTGYRAQLASDLYVATGDTCDWAYKQSGIFAFTTELEGGSFYPGTGIIERTVRNNVKAAVYLLGATSDPYSVLRRQSGSVGQEEVR